MPFASTAEVSSLLVFESVQIVLRAKGMIDCWLLFGHFSPLKSARTHCKFSLFPILLHSEQQ